MQKRFNLGETKRLIFSAEIFNLFNLTNIEINDNGGTNAGVTNYCVAVVPPIPADTAASIPRDCGFLAPTNLNFLQIRDHSLNASTFGKLLLTNNPGSPFQMQIGARFSSNTKLCTINHRRRRDHSRRRFFLRPAFSASRPPRNVLSP